MRIRTMVHVKNIIQITFRTTWFTNYAQRFTRKPNKNFLEHIRDLEGVTLASDYFLFISRVKIHKFD